MAREEELVDFVDGGLLLSHEGLELSDVERSLLNAFDLDLDGVDRIERLILIERKDLIEPDPGSRIGGAGGRTVRFVPARGAPVGRRMVIVRIGG